MVNLVLRAARMMTHTLARSIACVFALPDTSLVWGQMLQGGAANLGEHCWLPCGRRDGPCESFCGGNGLCCGDSWSHPRCDGRASGIYKHVCVNGADPVAVAPTAVLPPATVPPPKSFWGFVWPIVETGILCSGVLFISIV